MAEEIVVYCKQSGEPLIPLTVRIEWLPDGTIKPLLYWTPDGTCQKIVSLSPSVPLAYLKDGGAGLRFKVLGEIIETPEPDSELLHAQVNTYLYLADRRFCEKNIIDGRYGHAGKEYVPVTMDIFPDGDYELLYFWARGLRYMVEKTEEIDYRGSFQAGGIGVWHKVEIRQVNADDDEDPDPQKSNRRTGALFFELNKWFVTLKTT